MAKQLSKEDVEYLLNLTREDITLDLLKDLFANYEDKEAKFKTNDKFLLEKNVYHNKESITTTIGRFIMNKCLLEPIIIDKIGYQNIVLDDHGIGDLDGLVTKAFISGKIEIKDVYDYFDQCNWLGYAPTDFLVAGLTLDMYIVDPKVKALKEKLIEENKEKILKNDVPTINAIEDQLIEYSKTLIKDKPGYEIYESGCRGSFSNNYKNSVLMRGAVKDFTDPDQFNSSMASLTEGIPKEDFHIYANILTAGTYSRSGNTAKGGYLMKQYNRAFQHVMLDIKDSDCKTDKYISVNITNSNKKLFMFRYALVNGKEVLLDYSNMDDFVGKKVKFRSPMFCKGDKICNKCAGELLYKLDLRNAGLFSNVIGGVLQGKSMKMFHDSTIKVTDINYSDYIDTI